MAKGFLNARLQWTTAQPNMLVIFLATKFLFSVFLSERTINHAISNILNPVYSNCRSAVSVLLSELDWRVVAIKSYQKTNGI
jgi:hypothetical protein